MLENTSIFETAENKELDTLLKKYSDLKLQIQDLTTTQKQCADRIKELCNRKGGKYETLNFVFSLTESAGKSSIDVPLLKECYPKIWELLPSQCLSIKVSELKKNKDVWNKIPKVCIDKSSKTLSMGDITQKTNI